MSRVYIGISWFFCVIIVSLWVYSFSLTSIARSQYVYDEGLSFQEAQSFLYQAKPRCGWYDRGTIFLGSIDCLDQLPELRPDEMMEALQPYLLDVTTEYNALSREFVFTPSELVFVQELESQIDHLTKNLRTNAGEFLVVPKLLLAYDQLDEFKFVASVRDTTIYGPCRKQNYDLAMDILDEQSLEPWELLNMNTLIAHQPGYCTGWGKKYQFYAGVCGGSTQLFWNAILHPSLEVVERWSHGMWYAWFYGSSVMWDDSSIYESAKELIVQNISDSQIAFKTFIRESDGNTVLLSAQRTDQDWQTVIQKEQHGPRSALLRSTVSNGDILLSRDEWTSTYYGIDTSIDETAK